MNGRVGDVQREMRERLRGLGLRATSARLAALVELHEHAGPLSHEELMVRLGADGFDRATVYRILADLAEVGLLRRMDLGDHVWRFELDDGCRDLPGDHPHFLCEGCGVVLCLPPLEPRTVDGQVPEALAGARIQLRVSGICGRCVAA